MFNICGNEIMEIISMVCRIMTLYAVDFDALNGANPYPIYLALIRHRN